MERISRDNAALCLIDHQTGLLTGGNKQYRDLRFWSEGNADYWSGTSVKYPDRTMVGRIGIHSRRQWIEYVEKHYRGGKLESTTTFACRPIKPEIRDEDWKEGRKGA